VHSGGEARHVEPERLRIAKEPRSESRGRLITASAVS
jgi:hypothetical protein